MNVESRPFVAHRQEAVLGPEELDLLRSFGELRPLLNERAMGDAANLSTPQKRFSLGTGLSMLCHASVVVAALLAPVLVFDAVVELPAIEVEMLAPPEPPQGALQVASVQQTVEETPANEKALAKDMLPEVKPPVPVEEPQKPAELEQGVNIVPPLPKLSLEDDAALPERRPKIQPKPKRKAVEVATDEPDQDEIRAERARKMQERQQRADRAKMRAAKRDELKKAEEREARKASERADRAGLQEARAHTGMSQSTYAALVSAQINSNKHYPASAQSEGATGAVGITFLIGASGRARSASVIRSSGNGALDAAARQAVLAVNAPPPPQGSFSGNINIRFHLSSN